MNSNVPFQVTNAKVTSETEPPHVISNPFPQISSPPISHPGGSEDIDIHKVEVLGAASAVQKASATVPDQEHPEKYLNLDRDALEEVVNNNLWYEDTKVLKLNKIGSRKK